MGRGRRAADRPGPSLDDYRDALRGPVRQPGHPATASPRSPRTRSGQAAGPGRRTGRCALRARRAAAAAAAALTIAAWAAVPGAPPDTANAASPSSSAALAADHDVRRRPSTVSGQKEHADDHHSAEVLVASPGRNFVTLRITTDDGLIGLGDATVNGRELAVASYLRDHVVPLLIGRDAHRIEDTWQYLYRGAYWRRGPITMAAIAAVDTALWDIKAKARRACRCTSCSAAAAGSAAWPTGTRPGADLPELFDSIRAAPGPGLPGDPDPDRHPRASTRSTAWPPSAHAGTGGVDPLRPRAGPAVGGAGRGAVGHPRLPAPHPRRSSRRCATSSGRSCRCCTTRTTGSPRSRRPSSASRSSRTTCSGSRT